tara:strand:- start:1034 stop:2962 length:1929 start_codon:yes stop_codon:yes gene_type:complete
MADQKLNVILGVDSSKFNANLGKAQGRLKAFGSKLKSVGSTLSTRLSLPLALAGGAAIKMASDFEESMNKVDVAFKTSSHIVKQFAETTLETFGIAEGTALDMAALFGDMATSMGLSVDKAADMSTALVGLAGDLASFKNMNIEEVTTALNGVFTGETESLKRLGIVMTEINLKQFAQEQGIKKNIKAMTQAEKVNLRFQFVLKNTANAQGDFSRTSGGAANQMRIFQETIKELGVTFGQEILPTFTKIVTKVNDILKSFKNLDDDTKTLIVQIAAFAAILPPLIFAFGQISIGLSSVIAGFQTLAIAMTATPVGLMVTALAGLAIGFIELIHRIQPAVGRFETFINLLRSGGNPIKFNQLQIYSMSENLAKQGKAAEKSEKANKDFQDTILGIAQSAKKANNELRQLAKVSSVSALPKDFKDLTAIETGMSKIKSIFSKNDVGTGELTGDTTGISNLTNGLMMAKEQIDPIMLDISDTVVNGFSNIVMGMASGAMSLGDVAGGLIGMIADIAIQLGKAAIKIGVGMLKIKLAFTNPLAAIAAGTALVAIGSIMKGIAGSFGGGGGVQAFANGGIVSGPTLGLMGEYSGAKSNPEVIAPLNKLQGMIGQKQTNVNVGGNFRIQGQDLVLALQKADKQRNRII